ncbi:hypothetical protein K3495_g4391 [Podosphaera aphanis]|nr:hypothetical protein K3495_g4391 [Podosphaera aphanis]
MWCEGLTGFEPAFSCLKWGMCLGYPDSTWENGPDGVPHHHPTQVLPLATSPTSKQQVLLFMKFHNVPSHTGLTTVTDDPNTLTEPAQHNNLPRLLQSCMKSSSNVLIPQNPSYALQKSYSSGSNAVDQRLEIFNDREIILKKTFLMVGVAFMIVGF